MGSIPVVGINGVTLIAVANGTKTLVTQFEVGLSAAHAASNLAEAMSDNTYGANTTRIKATVNGDHIRLKSTFPGTIVNAVTLATTSATITTPASMSSGKTIARIYTMNRDASGKLLTTSNGGAITIANFTADENESQYIADRRILRALRDKDLRETFIRVGKVLPPNPLSASLTETIILIDIESPNDIAKK